MITTSGFIKAVLLLAMLAISGGVRPEPSGEELKKTTGKTGKQAGSGGMGGFFGPGSGFDIPGLGNGWGNGIVGGGYGEGYGGPTGGYSKGGVVRSTVVCSAPGPCYKKKLVCPAKCFTSYSKSGKNYGSGGGGGGCTMDCKKKCVAYC